MAVASVTVVVAAVSVTAPVDTAAMAHAMLKAFAVFNDVFCNGRRDIQHKYAQHNDTQHNYTQLNDIQHNDKLNTTISISIMTLDIMIKCCYDECHLC